MTDREKAIVTAYTGFCMLSGDKFRIFHEYIENIMGRPVYMHELAYKPFVDEIKEKAKADFIALCAEQEPEIWSCRNIAEDYADVDQFVCSECGIELQEWHGVERDEDTGDESFYEYTLKYCPNCGRRIEYDN